MMSTPSPHRWPWIGIIAVTLLLGSAMHGTAGDDPEARRIMERVDARDDGDNQTADMEMILIDRNGAKRVRRIATFSKDRGADTLRLMFFKHPADVRDTAFLTIDYDDAGRDDDQWLYLPALHKTKRIASADKSGSFMGSDLNYADMTDRELDDYDYRFYEKGREQVFDGVSTWAIWSIPRSVQVVDETGYAKGLLFVRQDNMVVVRSILWVKDSGDLKYMMVNQLERIDGIWVVTDMQVVRKRGSQAVHTTVMTLSNVRFDQVLPAETFSIRRMEKGY